VKGRSDATARAVPQNLAELPIFPSATARAEEDQPAGGSGTVSCSTEIPSCDVVMMNASA
jgi:hypothetical protein